MSHHRHQLPWSAIVRWIAMLSVCLAVGSGYVSFRPARAQDGQLPTAGTAAKSTPKSSAEIAKLAAGDLSTFEAEKKSGGPISEANTASVLRDIQWLSPHMWAFYAIWVVSLIAVAFAVERFLGLRRSRILPPDLAAGIHALASRKNEFDLRFAQRLCREYPSSAAFVIKAMLAKVGRPLPEVEHAMTEALEHEATRQFANVRVQQLAFNVAPMLGLAGTVHGIILCFYTTAHLTLGANKMDSLATGIYAALICTLAGLVVAIPAGILAYYFEGRILRLFQQVEDLARSLVPSLERFEGRSRAAMLGDMSTPGYPPGGSAAILGMPRTDNPHVEDGPLPTPKPKKFEGRP